MYSLDVNFLKDRQLEQEAKSAGQKESKTSSSGDSLILVGGLALLVLLPAAAFGYFWTIEQENAKLQGEITQIESKIAAARAERGRIDKIQKQIAQANDQNKALVSVFTKIKPWSAILQDIRDRIPPGVQIGSIQQSAVSTQSRGRRGRTNTQVTGIKLTIQGIANTHQDANDFLLTLKESKFLQPSETGLERTELIDNPLKLEYIDPRTGEIIGDAEEIELPQVVRYSIAAQLNDVPASQIVQELSKKGAVGLINRIRTLENKGAIR